jgi:hypothetical protein
MSSESNQQVITRPLPIIPSLQEARATLMVPVMFPQDALFLGLIPGLIDERKHGRSPTQRGVAAIANYVRTFDRPEAPEKVRTLL